MHGGAIFLFLKPEYELDGNGGSGRSGCDVEAIGNPWLGRKVAQVLISEDEARHIETEDMFVIQPAPVVAPKKIGIMLARSERDSRYSSDNIPQWLSAENCANYG